MVGSRQDTVSSKLVADSSESEPISPYVPLRPSRITDDFELPKYLLADLNASQEESELNFGVQLEAISYEAEPLMRTRSQPKTVCP